MVEIVKIKNAKVKDKGIESDIGGYGGTEDDTNIFNSTGIKALPHDNEDAVMIDVKGTNYIVATNNYNINITLDKGELVIYSSDSSGNILSNARCNKNGEFVINDGDRSAAAFDKLKEGFDELKADHNDLLTKFLAHIHVTTATVGPTAVPGVISATTITDDPSTASIDESEVPEVLLP